MELVSQYHLDFLQHLFLKNEIVLIFLFLADLITKTFAELPDVDKDIKTLQNTKTF